MIYGKQFPRPPPPFPYQKRKRSLSTPLPQQACVCLSVPSNTISYPSSTKSTIIQLSTWFPMLQKVIVAVSKSFNFSVYNIEYKNSPCNEEFVFLVYNNYCCSLLYFSCKQIVNRAKRMSFVFGPILIISVCFLYFCVSEQLLIIVFLCCYCILMDQTLRKRYYFPS